MIENLHKKHRNLLIWIGLLCPLLSGCWDRLEIEERANILGIAIDYIQKDEDTQKESDVSHLKHLFPKPSKNLIEITAQIAVPGRIPLGPESGSSGNQKPVWVLSSVGHTLDDAILNLQQEVADRLFLGHLRVIIVSDKFARKGVGELNDYLRRNPEVRRTAWMIISDGKASTLMESSPQLERIPTLYLSAMMDHAVSLGKFPRDFLGIFWSSLSKKGQEPFLPVIKVKRNENAEIAGMAYFVEDRMVGLLQPLEIGFFMAAKGIKQGGYAAFTPIPDEKTVVLARARTRRSQVVVNMKEGKPKIRLHIHVETDIDEKFNHGHALRPPILKKISTELSQRGKKSVQSIIVQTQKEGADILGLGEHIRAKLPAYWDSNIRTKENWRKAYQQLEVEVIFTTSIHRIGMKVK
ncbi:Ger(x)C family spore germination protein [Brevibacillus ruminantium]|uniref:Ger(X)C family spore germination protein n=1 Tax=Brevibacillus ruminantium TaxID=2950604 RepID=A0ABY4WPC1_9BACL|nr:Ger(x)C family spore germination protein [Brevibacillus ruminantium]USG67988.1 Ger(x)C family spore germination protein [Brevibacillus ruminantium]